LTGQTRALQRWAYAAMAAVLLTFGPAAAASSFTARFAEPVAGGVEQTARLIVDFFPGDGEAVTGLRARFPGPLTEVTSTRGRVLHEPGQAEFAADYAARPVGSAATDTLTIRLQTPGQALAARFDLFTNVDTGDGPAHRARVDLAVEPPLRATLAVEPSRLYPGETVEVILAAEPVADESRALRRLQATWPGGLAPAGPATHTGSSLRQAVRVAASLSGAVDVPVAVEGGGLRASPLEPVRLPVAGVASFAAEHTPARVGEPMTVTLRWTNRTDRPLQDVVLSAVAALPFARARLLEAGGGVRLLADEEKGSLEVRVPARGALGPGETVRVDVELTPLATGPIALRGGMRPADRSVDVPLSAVLVAVTGGPVEGMPSARMQTDLELASEGLRPRLREALASLPLTSGATVRLSSSRTDDGNWIVEGLLTEMLLERGVRVRTDTSASHELTYRLADARVVYSPAGGWNLFDDGRRRDARMEVFLRLEGGDGRVRWVRRVTSRADEDRAPAPADWLGGADGVDQAQVEADHRAIEIGLSGLIAGGLFFVFFAP
jgi:hypothetical protein